MAIIDSVEEISYLKKRIEAIQQQREMLVEQRYAIMEERVTLLLRQDYLLNEHVERKAHEVILKAQRKEVGDALLKFTAPN